MRPVPDELHEFDESSPLTEGALALIESTFDRPERQGIAQLRSEVEEKRLGLLYSYDFHLFGVADAEDHVLGTIVGAYLESVNCGFVTYLAVTPDARGDGIGEQLRARLVAAFRENARDAGYDDLDFVLGEVRSASPWLQKLIDGGAIPFAIDYHHPGMTPGAGQPAYTLYREPISGTREELSPQQVRRMLYSIYRRVYRVRYPLERPGFRVMIDELAERAGGL
jgi:GNAT superfamily N-acetyltransferase